MCTSTRNDVKKCVQFDTVLTQTWCVRHKQKSGTKIDNKYECIGGIVNRYTQTNERFENCSIDRIKLSHSLVKIFEWCRNRCVSSLWLTSAKIKCQQMFYLLYFTSGISAKYRFLQINGKWSWRNKQNILSNIKRHRIYDIKHEKIPHSFCMCTVHTQWRIKSWERMQICNLFESTQKLSSEKNNNDQTLFSYFALPCHSTILLPSNLRSFFFVQVFTRSPQYHTQYA